MKKPITVSEEEILNGFAIKLADRASNLYYAYEMAKYQIPAIDVEPMDGDTTERLSQLFLRQLDGLMGNV